MLAGGVFIQCIVLFWSVSGGFRKWRSGSLLAVLQRLQLSRNLRRVLLVARIIINKYLRICINIYMEIFLKSTLLRNALKQRRFYTFDSYWK